MSLLLLVDDEDDADDDVEDETGYNKMPLFELAAFAEGALDVLLFEIFVDDVVTGAAPFNIC